MPAKKANKSPATITLNVTTKAQNSFEKLFQDLFIYAAKNNIKPPKKGEVLEQLLIRANEIIHPNEYFQTETPA